MLSALKNYSIRGFAQLRAVRACGCPILPGVASRGGGRLKVDAGRRDLRSLVRLVAMSLVTAMCGSPAAGQPVTDLPRTESDDRRPLAALPTELAERLKKATALNPDRTVLLSADRKKVLLHTEVACRDCLLEMFCCLEQTKEHESILWLRGKAYVVHAALLATGTKPGSAATFSPDFRPPSGPVVDINVYWADAKGRLQKAKAQDWMRHSVSRYYGAPLKSPPPGVKLPLMELRYDPYNKEIIWFGRMTDKQRERLLELWDNADYQAAIRKFYDQSQPRPMTAEFVFAGSYEFTPEGSAKTVYAAEGGQLICVANFASATIDVREKSSASDGGQSYEAIAEKVPPRGTPVLVELVPRSSDDSSKTTDVEQSSSAEPADH